MKIVAIEKSPLADMLKFLGKGNFLIETKRALRESAVYIKKQWVDHVNLFAKAKQGWGEIYTKNIHINLKEDGNSVEVFADESVREVNWLETGIKRFDMKPGMLNGNKARVNKRGEKYNIIFFRKGNPKAKNMPAMSDVIYTQVKKATRYKVTSVSTDLSSSMGSLKMKTRTKVLNLKLKDKQEGMTFKEKFKAGYNKHKSGMYEGLTKTGKGGHSSYGTFRIVTKKSTGWIYPGSPGMQIRDRVRDKVQGNVVSILKEGVLKDIGRGLDYT